MNSMQHQVLRIEGTRPLRQHYEEAASSTLALLWRRRNLILYCVAIALLLAGVASLVIKNKYTADVDILVQLNANREEPGRVGPAPPPVVALDAAALIETEARAIRSRALAIRVAHQLGLDAAAPQTSFFGSLFGGGSVDPLEERQNKIATDLMKSLAVTNDTRSYLIRIAFTSTSPELSAKYVNTFAQEYMRSRGEAAAKRELSQLTSIYGPKHPSVLAAQAKLNAGQVQADSGAQIVMAAQPLTIPTSPNRLLIFAFAIGAAVGIGVLVILLLERLDTGFRTETDIGAELNAPCFGMVPELNRRATAGDRNIYAAAIQSVIAAAGIGTRTQSRITLITSSVPQEGKSLFCGALAGSLVTNGCRTLVIDASPRLSNEPESPGSAPTLEEVLSGAETNLIRLDNYQDRRISVLRRSSGMADSQRIFSSTAFERLLVQARELYDVVLIEAPPVILLSDALSLSRFADTIIHVVRWNNTPRKTVVAALERLQGVGVRIGGVVLARVDQKEHKKYSFTDASYYYRKYASFYATSLEQRRTGRKPEVEQK